MSDDPGEDLAPAERAAAEHLALLRDDPPTPGTALARRVMRTTRWQQALKAPLRVAAMIAGSLLAAVGVATRRGGTR